MSSLDAILCRILRVYHVVQQGNAVTWPCPERLHSEDTSDTSQNSPSKYGFRHIHIRGTFSFLFQPVLGTRYVICFSTQYKRKWRWMQNTNVTIIFLYWKISLYSQTGVWRILCYISVKTSLLKLWRFYIINFCLTH